MHQIEKSKLLDKHLDLIAEAYLHKMIREEYPEWIDSYGACYQCDEYYDSLLEAVVIK